MPTPSNYGRRPKRNPPDEASADYSEAIRVLKEDKGFSFREIAAWLQQRGLNTDHNAVWRAYSKANQTSPASAVSERNEQYERKTAQGLPCLGSKAPNRPIPINFQ